MVLQRFASVFSRYSDQKTVKYFCNRLFDKMFKSKSVTEDSIVKFGRAIDFHVKDVKLNKLLKKCFGQYNAYEIKSIIENTPDEEISKLSTVDAQRCLMNVINEEKDESIRQFIKMLCLPIQSYLEWCYDEYKTKVGLDEELFPDYVLEDIVKTKYFNKCGFVHSEYCLLSHFIQCNFEEETLMGKNEYLNIEIDLEKCDSIKSIVKMLVTNYQIINNVISAKGNNYSGTFRGALNLVNKLTPVWDKLLASSLMRDRSSTSLSRPSSNNLSDDEMFSVYAGKYSLVPRSYPEVTNVSANMIFNMHQFKQLSQQRKKQVCAYLENNKSRFNRLLNDAAETIHDELSNKLNQRNVDRLLSSNSTRQFHRCASLLNESFNKEQFNSPDKLLSYVVHEYIPIIKQFNNMNPNSKMTGGSTDGIVSMIQGGLELNDVFDEIYECKQTKPVYKYLPSKPEIKYITKYEPKYITRPGPSSVVVYGGDEIKTIEDYVKMLINIQEKFNNDYEAFYKGLIEELNSIQLPKEYINKTDLYDLIKQFEQIAIRNPKTTCYISGIYSARNYNRIYRDMVKTLINNIERSDFKFLDGVLNKLKDAFKLLQDTSKQINDVQIKMLSSPRGNNDYLIMNTRKILKPSDLNLNDFNNLSMAIRRLLSAINTMRVESDVYNFKNSLDNFIHKVEDRTKMIKEYYDMEKQRFIYENQESFFSYGGINTNIQRIFNALINRKQDAMIYFNTVVDMELAKLKIKDSSRPILSEKEMKRLEEIYLNFKYAQSSDKIDRIIEKIKSSTKYNSFEYILIIVKKLKALFKASGQVKMLTDIYKTLKIFPDDFDWKMFEDKYIDLIVLNTIKIDRLFKITNDKRDYNLMTYSQMIEVIANVCEKFVDDKVVLDLHGAEGNDNGRHKIKKVAYQAIHDVFDNKDAELKFINRIKNNTQEVIRSLVDANTWGTSSVTVDKSYEGQYYMPFIGEDNKIHEKYVQDISDYDEFIGCVPADDTGAYNSKKYSNYAVLDIMALIAQKLHNELKDHFMENGKITFDAPFYIKYWPLPVIEIGYLLRDDKGSRELTEFMGSNISITNKYGVTLSIERNIECDIASYSIEALYSNVIEFIDSYWQLKYNGNLPIIQGVSNALRGGNKIEGASPLDFARVETADYSDIIDEAVPFYLSALNVMDYYIRNFALSNEKTLKDDVMRLRLRFNKLSILYPIYDIFVNRITSLNGLTDQYLRQCLSVLNKIWNMTDGNSGNKLSKSIDILLNEIHSNFLFTSRATEDILEFTESPYQNNSVLDMDTEKIANVLKETLSNVFVTTTESNKYLETYLKKAYESVKGDTTNKLSKLKTFLTDSEKNDYYGEFYDFMDLVISPMLIINESYKRKFALFNGYSSTSLNTDKRSVDFHDIKTVYLDLSRGVADLKEMTVYDIIKNVRNGKVEYKSLLFYHPAVTEYNQNLLRQSLIGVRDNHRFDMPKFWIAMDENTYPLNSTYTIVDDIKRGVFNDFDKIVQIWGYIDGKTIGDYYNQCVSEFISDFNHILQSFILYPGLPDKIIKNICDKMKNAIKIDTVVDHTPYIKLDLDKDNEDYKRMLDELYNIKIRDIGLDDISPPKLQPTQIPPYNNGKNVEGLNITSVETTGSIKIGNQSMYVTCNNKTLKKIDYNWVDWVVFMIAKCDSFNFCLPFKLLTMLQSQPSIQKYIRIPEYILREQRIDYMANDPGTYNNIITQNIIARSSTDFNKDYMDYSTLPTIQIATIVSMVPYMISTLRTALKITTTKKSMYDGNTRVVINALVEVLTLFFYDISSFTPYIGFMADSLEVISGKDKIHTFGEVFADMYMTNRLSSVDDFLHLEWANKIFFSYISELKFPEYKNKPQFSKYETIVKDKINQPSFKNIYENMKSIVARNVWGYLIGKLPSRTRCNNYNNYNLITDILYIMADCDDKVVEKFINNFIKCYNGMKNFDYKHGDEIRNTISSLIDGIMECNIDIGSDFLSVFDDYTIQRIYTYFNGIRDDPIERKRIFNALSKGEKVDKIKMKKEERIFTTNSVINETLLRSLSKKTSRDLPSYITAIRNRTLDIYKIIDCINNNSDKTYMDKIKSQYGMEGGYNNSELILSTMNKIFNEKYPTTFRSNPIYNADINKNMKAELKNWSVNNNEKCLRKVIDIYMSSPTTNYLAEFKPFTFNELVKFVAGAISNHKAFRVNYHSYALQSTPTAYPTTLSVNDPIDLYGIKVETTGPPSTPSTPPTDSKLSDKDIEEICERRDISSVTDDKWADIVRNQILDYIIRHCEDKSICDHANSIKITDSNSSYFNRQVNLNGVKGCINRYRTWRSDTKKPGTNSGTKNSSTNSGTNSGTKKPGTNSGTNSSIKNPGTNSGTNSSIKNPGTKELGTKESVLSLKELVQICEMKYKVPELTMDIMKEIVNYLTKVGVTLEGVDINKIDNNEFIVQQHNIENILNTAINEYTKRTRAVWKLYNNDMDIRLTLDEVNEILAYIEKFTGNKCEQLNKYKYDKYKYDKAIDTINKYLKDMDIKGKTITLGNNAEEKKEGEEKVVEKKEDKKEEDEKKEGEEKVVEKKEDKKEEDENTDENIYEEDAVESIYEEDAVESINEEEEDEYENTEEEEAVEIGDIINICESEKIDDIKNLSTCKIIMIRDYIIRQNIPSIKDPISSDTTIDDIKNDNHKYLSTVKELIQEYRKLRGQLVSLYYTDKSEFDSKLESISKVSSWDDNTYIIVNRFLKHMMNLTKDVSLKSMYGSAQVNNKSSDKDKENAIELIKEFVNNNTQSMSTEDLIKISTSPAPEPKKASGNDYDETLKEICNFRYDSKVDITEFKKCISELSNINTENLTKFDIYRFQALIYPKHPLTAFETNNVNQSQISNTYFQILVLKDFNVDQISILTQILLNILADNADDFNMRLKIILNLNILNNYDSPVWRSAWLGGLLYDILFKHRKTYLNNYKLDYAKMLMLYSNNQHLFGKLGYVEDNIKNKNHNIDMKLYALYLIKTYPYVQNDIRKLIIGALMNIANEKYDDSLSILPVISTAQYTTTIELPSLSALKGKTSDEESLRANESDIINYIVTILAFPSSLIKFSKLFDYIVVMYYASIVKGFNISMIEDITNATEENKFIENRFLDMFEIQMLHDISCNIIESDFGYINRENASYALTDSANEICVDNFSRLIENHGPNNLKNKDNVIPLLNALYLCNNVKINDDDIKKIKEELNNYLKNDTLNSDEISKIIEKLLISEKYIPDPTKDEKSLTKIPFKWSDDIKKIMEFMKTCGTNDIRKHNIADINKLIQWITMFIHISQLDFERIHEKIVKIDDKVIKDFQKLYKILTKDDFIEKVYNSPPTIKQELIGILSEKYWLDNAEKIKTTNPDKYKEYLISMFMDLSLPSRNYILNQVTGSDLYTSGRFDFILRSFRIKMHTNGKISAEAYKLPSRKPAKCNANAMSEIKQQRSEIKQQRSKSEQMLQEGGYVESTPKITCKKYRRNLKVGFRENNDLKPITHTEIKINTSNTDVNTSIFNRNIFNKNVTIDRTKLAHELYNVDIPVLLIRFRNIKPLIQNSYRNILLKDEMFNYIFDSPVNRQYYLNSIRNDIHNATIRNMKGVGCVNSTFYHAYYNVDIACIDTKNSYDEGYINDSIVTTMEEKKEKIFDIFNYGITLDNKTPEYFDLTEFTTSIISNKFDNLNINANIDHGFATRLNVITGGYNQYDVVSNFINIYDYANNRQGEPKYIYSYDNDMIESKRLFDALFKDYELFYNNSFRQSDVITSYVFNYFHKFNISCASIYNRILFPNIIYNSSVLRKYISTLAKNIQNVNLDNDSVEQIFKFLKTLRVENTDAFSMINDWRYNIFFEERRPDETYTKFNQNYNGKCPQMLIINVNSTPSLINRYFIKLLKSIAPKIDENDLINSIYRNSLVTSLYNSPFMIEFNHINLVNTVVYSILRILKMTSYYDPVTDSDYTYSNAVILEPFVE